jgi:hypothetical protein
MIISIPIPDPLLDKKLMDSIKEYVEKNPIPPPPDGGSIIYLEEFAINGGEIEDKICESIKRKRKQNG